LFKFFAKVFSLIICSSLSYLANASLITNGSFEQLSFSSGEQVYGKVFNTNLTHFNNKRRGWDVFELLPGWETIDGHGIELQKNIVTRSNHGSYHLELDSHPRGASNSVMKQTLSSLTIGQDYLLEFYYKPRTNRQNDNGINVYWFDSNLTFNLDFESRLVSNSTRNESPDWTKQSVLLTASAESMNLGFGAFGSTNTLGGLVDNVSLTQVAEVPEPTTLILFLFAIVALTLIQKHKATVVV